MNWQQFLSEWDSVRDMVHAEWERLTDEDLKAINGDRNTPVKSDFTVNITGICPSSRLRMREQTTKILQCPE